MPKSAPFIKFNTAVGQIDSLLQQFSQGVLVTDHQGEILKSNLAFEMLSAYNHKELIGSFIDALQISPFPLSVLNSLGSWKGETAIRQKNGETLNLWLEILTFQANPKKKYFTFLYREFHPLALLDPLTNLPNRRCFQQCLEKTLKKGMFHDGLSLLFVDLDRFKYVNDTLGHTCGDELLIETVTRLKSCLRKRDILARLGGDEFICLLPKLNQKVEAEAVAERMLKELSRPFKLLEHEVYITASIGLCMYPLDGETIDTLITNADLAMYRAKKQGKNQFQWFKAEYQAADFETFMLENHLRKALKRNELLLHYQPLMNLSTGKVIAVEALLRWDHPDLGLISPGDFIPLAEETGMIIPIGTWVLREACRQTIEWKKQGYPPVKISVNLSPKQFLLRDLPITVKNILEETGLTPDDLIIEITENMIIQDFDTAISNLNSLKNMGIIISIDDFGTGYSSLTYLSKLPIDNVKIDRSFIKDIEANQRNQILTKAIISLAHALELDVVAEGIETAVQMNEVKNMDCDVIQGFLISKPLKPEEVCNYFR